MAQEESLVTRSSSIPSDLDGHLLKADDNLLARSHTYSRHDHGAGTDQVIKMIILSS
ncbi:hypothetical protein VTN96DRAFT_6591 [Rasamsonia emersonii]